MAVGAATGSLVVAGPISALGVPAASAAAHPAAAMGMVEVKVATVANFGRILVDQAGMALYYNSDTKPPSKWWCTGQCLTAWPPLVLGKGQSKPALGKGVSGVSIVKDASGAQVTWHGKPLYTFIKDKAGTVKGQGIKDVWYVAQLSKSPSGGSGGVAY